MNKAIIELIRKLLFTDDYISVAGQISNASDVINILDLMLYLLRNGHLSNFDAKLDTNSRARRLMMKIITKTPVMPRSLFVTEVSMKSNREYIGGGGFGHVFKGKLGGEAVALKVLYKTHDNIVSDTLNSWSHLVYFVQGFLPRSIDVAIPQSQIRITLLRDLRN